MRLLALLLVLALLGCARQVSEAGVGGTATLEGSFQGADSFHQGGGTARVYGPAGSQTLRLEEDFWVRPGPDLYVWLVKAGGVSEGYVELGQLKGSSGSQNYSLPAATDMAQYPKVVIWCKAFSVLFASAELKAIP
jgi:hypothetical protein